MKKILLFSINIIFCFSLMAQETMSLAQAIEIGIKNNYQIQIAKRNLQVAQTNNDWKATGRYPRVDFNVNSRNGYANAQSPGFLLESSTLSAGLTPSVDATWTIYDGKRIDISKRQLEGIEKQTGKGILIATENTVQSIILAYNRILIQQEQLKTLKEVIVLSRDRIEFQNIRKEFGQGGKFDILQTENAYLNDSTSILIQENNVLTAFRDLNLAMGQDDLNKTYQLTETLDFQPNTYELDNLKKSLFANNQNLQSLIISRGLASINTEFQESFKKPTVSLGTGLSYNLTGQNGTQLIAFGGQPPVENENNGTNKTFNFYVNLQMSYNLYDAGAKKRNIENAKVNEVIAQLNIDDLKRTLSSQLQNALANYNNQLRLVNLTESLIENAKSNLTIGEERFKGGLINSFDYRSLQLAFVNASQSRLNAIFNLKNTEVQLMRLTGDLIK